MSQRKFAFLSEVIGHVNNNSLMMLLRAKTRKCTWAFDIFLCIFVLSGDVFRLATAIVFIELFKKYPHTQRIFIFLDMSVGPRLS